MPVTDVRVDGSDEAVAHVPEAARLLFTFLLSDVDYLGEGPNVSDEKLGNSMPGVRASVVSREGTRAGECEGAAGAEQVRIYWRSEARECSPSSMR